MSLTLERSKQKALSLWPKLSKFDRAGFEERAKHDFKNDWRKDYKDRDQAKVDKMNADRAQEDAEMKEWIRKILKTEGKQHFIS